MATDTIIRIKRNPYHGYEVWLWANGELTRRCFDNTIDLAAKLAADCVSDRDIEMACDQFERLEWQEPEYPLGVSWVGPQYDPNAWAFDDLSEPTCTCDLCRLGSNQVLLAKLQASKLETAKSIIGFSFMAIALLIWRPWA
jgi:hypothetical protein